MELTPLHPAPLPVFLFGLGSVCVALTTLALATPSPQYTARRLARPGHTRFLYAGPPSTTGLLCPAASVPRWLQCEGSRCVIDRDGWQQAQTLRSPQLPRRERFVPALRSGRPVGMRLTEIPPCSRAYWLGLRSGDLLTRVNGRELATREHVLGAYAQLRTASHFTVDVERAGRNVTYEYVVR